MLPVILNLWGFTLSSFGLFLFLGLVASMFTIWRLGKLYEVNEENLSNLALISFFGGLIGARLFSIILNLTFFDSFEKVILVNKYPGLSLWGGLIGGFITVVLIYRRYKFNLYQILDFLSVGVLIGLVFGEIGCFLGGCNSGVVTNLGLSALVVGLIGKRLTISLIEAAVFLLLFRIFWRKAIRFHIWGGLFSVILLNICLVLFLTSFLKDPRSVFDQTASAMGIIIGVMSYYLITKKSFITDLKYSYLLISSRKKQAILIERYKKSWNNFKVKMSVTFRKKTVRLQKIPRSGKLRRLLNVKPTPENLS